VAQQNGFISQLYNGAALGVLGMPRSVGLCVKMWENQAWTMVFVNGNGNTLNVQPTLGITGATLTNGQRVHVSATYTNSDGMLKWYVYV
jgi:hypothetical protein